MVEVGEVGSQFADKLSFSSIATGVGMFITFLIITAVLGVVLFFVFRMLRYNKTVIIFEDVAGQGLTITGKDRGMLVKVGDEGAEVLYLQKRKVYRTAYGHKTGKNTFWFAIGEDGYWYNIIPGDLNTKLRELEVNPTDVRMRYLHSGIKRNMKDRFEKITFLQKYGGMIMFIMTIAVAGVMQWLLFDKYLQIAGAVEGAIDKAVEVQEATRQIIGGLDALKGTGSIVAVG